MPLKIRKSQLLNEECQAFYERLLAKGSDDLEELHELAETSCPGLRGDGFEDFESGFEFAAKAYELRMRYGNDFGKTETKGPVDILRGVVCHGTAGDWCFFFIGNEDELAEKIRKLGTKE